MPSAKGQLSIHVDAGFRSAGPGAPGEAGLGAWIPALGTGVSLAVRAEDVNGAEVLAILLGLLVGGLRGVERPAVLSDSKASVLRFTRDADTIATADAAPTAVGVVARALARGDATLAWRPREETTLADFFATLALEGKSLVASTANARNPGEKFRPLLRADRKDKTPLKDVRVAWLSLPNPPKAPFDAHASGLERLAPGIGALVGAALPAAELRVLVDVLVR